MFAYIKGTLIQSEPVKVIVDVRGIGYLIHIPISAFSELPQLGSEVLLYTSFVVKEDSQTLFGFLSQEEKELFEILKTISGVGPKTALALIGYLDISQFHNAVSNADTRIISKVPGIGKKTAERLIIELRDKLKTISHSSTTSLSSSKNPEDNSLADAISALINLGFHPIKARKAVKTIIEEANEEKMDTGQIISLAMQKI